MTRIILDDATTKKLLDLRQPLELCDASGKVMGHFTPTADRSEPAQVQPELSDAELRRREQEPEFSTEQVLAYLEGL